MALITEDFDLLFIGRMRNGFVSILKLTGYLLSLKCKVRSDINNKTSIDIYLLFKK